MFARNTKKDLEVWIWGNGVDARKEQCVSHIGWPINEATQSRLGNSPRILARICSLLEVKQIMKEELAELLDSTVEFKAKVISLSPAQPTSRAAVQLHRVVNSGSVARFHLQTYQFGCQTPANTNSRVSAHF
ncbi:hypothetical protein FH972_009926 [Carpinus fangiana]|uniref:Uncharacterized protein n=1 Tax=Carpinus fangiana TaxID=176857 RepID=A0A660KLT3_9ROSI|nr:hypothetical protein FH972_009926 [Carpinus fangiana]